MSTKCENDMDCRTMLVNNTNDALIYLFFLRQNPDTLNYGGACLSGVVSPHSRKEICTGEGDYWEDKFSRFETNNVQILIYSNDTVKKYGMNDLLKNKKYHRYINVTREELESMNWKIICP